MNIYLGGETAFEANEPFGELLRKMKKSLKSFEEADENDDTYGTEFKNIGIITMILSPDLDGIRERRYISRKNQDADIRLRIDYIQFINSDANTQLLLYLKNIVDSIKVVNERKKADFNGDKLIEDILNVFGLNMEKLLDALEKTHN